MTAAPEPQDWLRGYARVQRAADREILALLREGIQELNAQLADMDLRTNVSDAVRRYQFRVVRANLMEIQNEVVWRRAGQVMSEGQKEAARKAIDLGSDLDDVLFRAVGAGQVAEELRRSLTVGMKQTLETALGRMESTPVPLSSRVYRTEVWASGVLDSKINSALVRGLSAREFASEARDWISPNTPGGLRYASLRLARTEINNAFHAVSVAKAREKPWVTGMQWNISSSHPKPDQCDQYAKDDHAGMGPGVFRKEDVPRKPHPQCFCYVTPVTEKNSAFLDNLVGGKYDDYINSKTKSGDSLYSTSTSRPRAAPKATKTAAPARPIQTPASASVAPPSGKLASAPPSASVDRVLARTKPGEATERVRAALNLQAQMTPKAMDRLKSVSFKSVGKATNAEYFAQNAQIAVNPKFAAKQGRGDRALNEFTKYSCQCGKDHDSLQATISHEYGHHVHMSAKWTQEQKREVFDTFAREIGVQPPAKLGVLDTAAWIQQHKDVVRLKVSKYAATSEGELMAEIWSEYSTNPNARPAARSVGGLMHKFSESR